MQQGRIGAVFVSVMMSVLLVPAGTSSPPGLTFDSATAPYDGSGTSESCNVEGRCTVERATFPEAGRVEFRSEVNATQADVFHIVRGYIQHELYLSDPVSTLQYELDVEYQGDLDLYGTHGSGDGYMWYSHQVTPYGCTSCYDSHSVLVAKDILVCDDCAVATPTTRVLMTGTMEPVGYGETVINPGVVAVEISMLVRIGLEAASEEQAIGIDEEGNVALNQDEYVEDPGPFSTMSGSLVVHSMRLLPGPDWKPGQPENPPGHLVKNRTYEATVPFYENAVPDCAAAETCTHGGFADGSQGTFGVRAIDSGSRTGVEAPPSEVFSSLYDLIEVPIAATSATLRIRTQIDAAALLEDPSGNGHAYVFVQQNLFSNECFFECWTYQRIALVGVGSCSWCTAPPSLDNVTIEHTLTLQHEEGGIMSAGSYFVGLRFYSNAFASGTDVAGERVPASDASARVDARILSMTLEIEPVREGR